MQENQNKLLQKIFQRILSMHNIHFLYIDIAIFLFTPFLALYLRLGEINLLTNYQNDLIIISLIFTLNKNVILFFGGLYRRIWQQASVDELARIIIVCILLTISQFIIFYILKENLLFSQNIPYSVPIIDGLLTLIFIGGFRFTIRLSERIYKRLTLSNRHGKSILIVGAGDAGIMIAEELQSNPQLGLTPVGFVDDDKQKLSLKIRGLTVLGSVEDIPQLVETLNIFEIIIAIPTATGKVIREINNICQKTGAKTRTMPGIFELLNGNIKISSLRKVAIEDLLRRESVQTRSTELLNFIKGKKVLITGGGGSIGSELCRQIARYEPAQLIILGHGENSIFAIANELSLVFPGLQYCPVIVDIRDETRINKVFRRFNPEIVYHAAAHKHVPMMEINPSEAVTNNIIGTFNIVKAALNSETKQFVQISTDKAVNSTNIMGATKRIAELIIYDAFVTSGRQFVSVRFGNVLGSRGSVVPTFEEQIAKGGPLTITHPEVKRYFMTIPEAVQLVISSSSIGKGGEIFVLDMGEPIKILDLAKDLIRLSGYADEKEIEIIYTGLRPGEKLFEELILSGERFEKTKHPKIFVVKNGSRDGSQESLKYPKENYLNNIVPFVKKAKLIASKGDKSEIGKFLEENVEGFKYISGIETI